MTDEHTVEVTFRKDFSEHDDTESFVESCLTGRRAQSFASNVSEIEVKEQDDD